MSVLVVGVSHRTAPMSVLERLSVSGDRLVKLVHDVAACDDVLEATVVSTCNRVEVYADVDRFHGSVEAVSRLLGAPAEEHHEDVTPALYVHYDDAAVSHLFEVVAGLDSMVVGEGQILGQVREALRLGQEEGTVGPALNAAFQQALRVGKRVHAETDIDKATPSLVALALDRAVAEVGPVAGRRVVVVGAGSMAGLALATVTRQGAGSVVVASRTEANARRAAARHGVLSVPMAALDAEIARADFLISCTASAGVVLPVDRVVAARAGSQPPLGVVDLALPHDVDPRVGQLPGVALVGLPQLAEDLSAGALGAEYAASTLQVRDIVGAEITAFLAARASASVTPTVVALRMMATGVVDAEVERLLSRLPHLAERDRAEIEQAVRRVADKLLHRPTVRVRELAQETGEVSYATALAKLFALDPDEVQAVTRPGGV